MRHTLWISAGFALLVAGCGSETPQDSDDADLTISMDPPAQGYQLVTEPYEVPAFTEVDICSVVHLQPKGDEQLVWVDHMESLTSSGTHHMNVVLGQFSFLDGFLGEGAAADALGTSASQLPCSELSSMELGFPVFPSQRENQEITFPEGVAVPMTAPLTLVFSHHYVNTRDTPVIINAALNLSTVPAEEVEEVGSLIFSDIGDLEVAPQTRRTEARTCVVERDVEVVLVSTHSHEWATCATMNHYDGASGAVEAESFYVNKQWDQPPILHFEPETFSLSAGDGIHWACHYENDTEGALVNDGTAAGEMCVLAAVTWPAPLSVAKIEQVVAEGDLAVMVSLLGDFFGPCDSVRDDVPGPWPTGDAALDGEAACADFTQTESNTLE